MMPQEQKPVLQGKFTLPIWIVNSTGFINYRYTRRDEPTFSAHLFCRDQKKMMRLLSGAMALTGAEMLPGLN